MNKMDVPYSSKVHHERTRCKSATGLHSLKKHRFTLKIFKKCHICDKRHIWPHVVLKCETCSYWRHKKCVPMLNKTPIEHPNGAAVLGNDDETESLSEELDRSDRLVAETFKPQLQQMSLVNVNNCMVLSIQFPNERTSHQTSRRIEPEISCTSITSPPTLPVPRSDLRSRSTVTSIRNRRRFTTPQVIVLLPPIEDPFRLLNLFAHDTREIYDASVLGAIQHVRSYDVSRPVRPPRRKKIAAPMVNDRRQIVGKNVDQKSLKDCDGDPDDDLDYEILLFCRSPYRMIRPLRTSIPTWDLWY